MTVQVPPKQAEQKSRQAQKSPGSLRKYLVGGLALLLILGGYWYYTNMQGAALAGRGRPQTAAPVKVAVARQQPSR